jgi:hypothetical protein
MNPRITSIENLIASDPGGRNVFGLVVADQLRLAAQSLRLARRVGIVSGFFVLEAGAGETDGPPGALVLGRVLTQLGIDVDYITDERNAPLFRALGVEPITSAGDYLDRAGPTHLVAVERVGRARDGRYRNMRGVDITDVTAPLDELFLAARERGLTTVGIGDGGNEIGMGKVFADALLHIRNGKSIATVVPTDFCIAAGVSNWGAFGLAGAISVLAGKDLLPTAAELTNDFERLVHNGGAVDGVTLGRELTCDGLPLSDSIRMLEGIRRHIAPSPFAREQSLLVGVLGYGETGKAAASLLSRHGHRVRISDMGPVTVEAGTTADGVEAGIHSIDFFRRCDAIVMSPGIAADSPILGEMHHAGIPVMSEIELAFQLGFDRAGVRPPPLVAVTGTIGKRTTVERMHRFFVATGRSLVIGGNKGAPLSQLLLQHDGETPIAVAVSSFQLESVVHFRPDVAVILNIDDAHLDRHRSIAEYMRIKSRVFMNQRPGDVLILPFDDERLRPLARKHHGRTLFISTRHSLDRGAWLVDGRLRMNVDGDIEDLGPVQTDFPLNLLATVLSARHCGVTQDDLVRVIESERGPGARRQ